MKKSERDAIIKEYHELHKELWNWLSKHPAKHKEVWPKWEYNGGRIKEVAFDCFACEVAFIFSRSKETHCKYCLLEWPEKKCQIQEEGALYDLWLEANGEERSRLAKEIANLPLNKKWR